MNRGTFHKSPAAKFLNFLFILPLFLGLRPLFINYHLIDTLIFIGGMLLILGLIIYNNTVPYIVYDETALKILLPYREDREEHRFDSMLGYRKKGSRRVTLFSLDHKPLKISLRPDETIRFINLLNDEGIAEEQKVVSHGR
jgi:hypothetical protein